MISDVTYTEEEEALSAELCDAINADKQSAKKATQEAGEMLKALTMHMYVKVVVKKKDSPSLN